MTAQKGMYTVGITVLSGVLSLSPWVSGETLKNTLSSMVPKEYQGKRMPNGWWTDPRVIAEGKRIYEGKTNGKVICAACHGRNGKPVLRGARNLTDAAFVSNMTDSYWYWRIAEGVTNTPMKGWKEQLTEDQIWKVIAYTHTFSHARKPAAHDH